jgi:hypothetical protein
MAVHVLVQLSLVLDSAIVLLGNYVTAANPAAGYGLHFATVQGCRTWLVLVFERSTTQGQEAMHRRTSCACRASYHHIASHAILQGICVHRHGAMAGYQTSYAVLTLSCLYVRISCNAGRSWQSATASDVALL